MTESQSIDVITFGCRLNTIESEAMRRSAMEAGHRDLVIFNTCAVTAEAMRQARQAIRRMAREKPNKKIIVTGCAAQIAPDTWATLPGVTRVLGNEDKLKPESWAEGAPGIVSDIMAARETAPHLVTEFAGRARAFVQVQQGCDHRCTFCVIPFGRGPNRSVPIGAIVEQARTLVAGGYQEIVLTGVDIASYGAEVVQKGQNYSEALALCDAWIAESGAAGVHAYDAEATLEGQGTLARVRAAFGAVLESVEPLSEAPAAPIFEEDEHEE